jgi:hypothetical protein
MRGEGAGEGEYKGKGIRDTFLHPPHLFAPGSIVVVEDIPGTTNNDIESIVLDLSLQSIPQSIVHRPSASSA